MKILDYIYYRSYIFAKKSGDDNYKLEAFMTVSFFEFFLLAILFCVVLLITDYPIRENTPKYYAIYPMVVIWILNYFHYKKEDKIEKLIAEWEKETANDKKNKTIWMWIIIMILISCFSILINMLGPVKN